MSNAIGGGIIVFAGGVDLNHDLRWTKLFFKAQMRLSWKDRT